jgi:hypothetical protein
MSTIVFTMLLALSAGGCVLGPGGPMESLIAIDSPHVNGTWKGRVMPMTVRDINGTEYQAVVLEVASGARMPYEPAGGYDYVATDRRPLLLKQGKPATITAPADYKIRMGTWVEVDGRMMASSVRAPVGVGVIEPISKEAAWKEGAELVILMRGGPKVLEDQPFVPAEKVLEPYWRLVRTTEHGTDAPAVDGEGRDGETTAPAETGVDR